MALDAARIDRVVSAEVGDRLERIAASDMLASGGVNLIGLEAIRDHLGDRWPAKRDRIWEHVERDLDKRLGPIDMAVRLDETTFLVAMPGASRFAAQAVCLHALQEILTFFLGESRPADIRVRTVTALTGQAVESAPLDAAELARQARTPPQLDITTDPAAEPEQTAKAWVPPLAGRRQSGLFTSRGRTAVEIRLGVEPVRNLRRDLVTSYLIERATQPRVNEPADLIQVDVAVMAYAATLMQEHERTGGRLTLHAPVSYASAASRRGRELALQILGGSRQAARETLLIELADLDPGVPPSRLVEIVALLKPFCLGVLARVRPSLKALEAVRDCGLRGVILEASSLAGRPGDFGAVLKAFASAAHPIATNLIVHGLEAPGLVRTAALAGFTHASLAPDLRFDAQAA